MRAVLVEGRSGGAESLYIGEVAKPPVGFQEVLVQVCQ